MSPRNFDPRDPSTWNLVLTLDQVAAIYGRDRDTIRHSLKPSRRSIAFTPSPYKRHPMLWRKADVIRDLRANDPILAEVR